MSYWVASTELELTLVGLKMGPPGPSGANKKKSVLAIMIQNYGCQNKLFGHRLSRQQLVMARQRCQKPLKMAISGEWVKNGTTWDAKTCGLSLV